MSGKNAFRDLRTLKRDAVNQISRELSDQEIFLSPETRDYVNALAKAVTGRYSVGAIQVNVDYNPLNKDLGYTCGDSIYINAGHLNVLHFRSLSDRMMFVSSILYHELAHCVYLDFAKLKQAESAMKRGVLHGGFPVSLSNEEKKALFTLRKMLMVPQFHNLIANIYHDYFNILSDEHDERALMREYGEYEQQCITMFKRSMRVTSLSYEGQCSLLQHGKISISKFLNNMILLIARFGHVQVVDPDFVIGDTVYSDLMDLRDLIEDNVENGASADLIPVANYMMLKLWSYLYNEIMSSAQQMVSGKSGGNSAQQNPSQGQSSDNGEGDSQMPPENASSIIDRMMNSNQNQPGNDGSSSDNGSQNSQPSGQQSSAQSQNNGAQSSGSSGQQSSSSPSGAQSSNGNGEQQSGQGSSSGAAQNSANGGSSSTNASRPNGSAAQGSSSSQGSAGGNSSTPFDEKALEQQINDMLNKLSPEELDKLVQDIANQMASDLANDMSSATPDRPASKTSPESKKQNHKGSGSNSQQDKKDESQESADGSDQKQGSSADGKDGSSQDGATTDNTQQGSNPADSEQGGSNRSKPGDLSDTDNGTTKSPDPGQSDDASGENGAMDSARDQAESALNQIRQQIANRKADESIDQKASDELVSAAKNAALSDLHKGYPCKIIRELHEKGKAEYTRVASEQKSLLNALVRQMERIFKDMQVGSVKPRQVVGTAFRATDAYRLDGQCFITKKAFSNKPDIAITVLVDRSGSMSWADKSSAAQKSAVLLYDFCQKMDIPCMVCGHSHSGGMRFEIFSDFRPLPDDKYRIANGLASGYSGCNRDGMALQIAGDLLGKRPEPVKLLIIISDGKPSAYDSDTQAIQDIQETVKKASRKGIHTIAFAIGDSDENACNKVIYGDRYVDAADVTTLPKKLARLVKRFITISMN